MGVLRNGGWIILSSSGFLRVVVAVVELGS